MRIKTCFAIGILGCIAASSSLAQQPWGAASESAAPFLPGPPTYWTILDEDFDIQPWPPLGWTVIDNTGNGSWNTSSAFNQGNQAGLGECAAIDSDYYGTVNIDGELLTPLFNLPAGATTLLAFDHYYLAYSGSEIGEVDISVNGGPWANLASYTSNASGHVELDLSAYAGGPNCRIRFHYYQANYDWFWHVDNIEVYRSCDGLPTLVIDTVVNISDLDGGPDDLDGAVNDKLTVAGLVVERFGKIVIDVPWAIFDVCRDVMLRDQGKIENDVYPYPASGPWIDIYTRGSIHMSGTSAIRSFGSSQGGWIYLIVHDDFTMDHIAGLEATGFDLPRGDHGGTVTVMAGGNFRMNGMLTYITVEAIDAGLVYIQSGTAWDRSVYVRGRILADGTGPGGFGGTILLTAPFGGLWLPGVDNCLATGEGADGAIFLNYHTIIAPIDPPLVSPDPIITHI